MALNEIKHGRDAILAALVVLAACAQQPTPQANTEPHPLMGMIWDVNASAFVSQDALFDRLAQSRYIILGETHDNPEQHRLQRSVLEGLAARGQRSVLAMEQFDSQYQAEIDAARMRGADAEGLADAGHFDRKGWNWPLYKPLLQFALEFGWPIAAANLSRSDARAIVADPARSGLPPADPYVDTALSRDISESHCGQTPDAKLLRGMVEAQRARDARMASVFKRDTVLIAGAGHARRDRGVPIYIDGKVASLAFIETESDKTAPAEYEQSYDYLWFTSRAAREDPCGK
ncbi:MAG TPA: ChaN family lipoprotein [Terriglobales bacterium]|nr:ChaN family lipoprotein [Terriglobales bacterium]